MALSKRFGFYYGFLLFYLVFQIFLALILREYNQDTHNNAFKILDIYKELSVRLNQPGEVDNSGVYRIFKVKSSKLPRHDITVVSQCSPNHFLSVDKLFRAWEGPISVAIYSEIENIEMTLWDVARFLHCHNWRDFQMQLVLPLQDEYIMDYKFAIDLLLGAENSVSCSSPYISGINKRKNYDWGSPYPINLLRNIAKREALTDYIFVIDIDMIPNSKLRKDFLHFMKLSTTSEKVVYVVPAFEALEDVKTPTNKTELIKLFFSFKVRPFYSDPCSDCQKLTDYMGWLSAEDGSEIKIYDRVKWKHPWEPFFIAKNDTPNFDERFKQYGMNRVSQICELHVAGFEFLILDNAFLIHRGFKKAEDFHPGKNTDMDINRRVYKRFKTEIKFKYPDSERSC